MLSAIETAFVVSPWLFIVPLIVVIMIIKNVAPLIALFSGTLMAAVAALIAQPELVSTVGGGVNFDVLTAYKGIVNAMTVSIEIPTAYAP